MFGKVSRLDALSILYYTVCMRLFTLAPLARELNFAHRNAWPDMMQNLNFLGV